MKVWETANATGQTVLESGKASCSSPAILVPFFASILHIVRGRGLGQSTGTYMHREFATNNTRIFVLWTALGATDGGNLIFPNPIPLTILGH